MVIIRHFKFIAVVLCMTCFIGCRIKDYDVKIIGGIKKHINSNRSIDLKSTFTLKEIFSTNKSDEIDSLYYCNDPVDVDLDDLNNLFILDYKTLKIAKYNSKSFHTSFFGGKGDGPGELLDAVSLNVLKDTVYIANIPKNEIAIFNTKGIFLRTIKLPVPMSYFNIIDKDKPSFLAPIPNTRMNGGVLELKKELTLYDYSFSKRTIIYSKSTSLGGNKSFNPFNYMMLYASNGKNMIALVENDEYEFSIFDNNGLKKEIVKKQYKKIPVTKEYIAKIENQYQLRSYQDKKEVKFDIKYKHTIKSIKIDKNNRVWISYETDELNNNRFDIFDNGKYIGYVNFNKDFKNLYFKKDKLIILSKNNKLTVYDYQL